MKLERLILRDFLSYEELDYYFESRPLLVQGLNLTDDGQKTNGTGKSALQTGIEQLITFTNSRGVNDAELITYGKKQTNMQLYACCDVRKERIHIDSTINLKGSNLLSVSLCKYGSEEWIPANFSTVPDGKKYVAEWFAISKEDLFNYFIINNSRFKSFFKSSNSEKVALINRFSDASIVKDIEQIDLGPLTEQLEKAKIASNAITGKIELVTESIEKEKVRDFKEELKEEQKEFDEQILEIKEEIEEEEEKIQLKLDSKPKINKELKSLKSDGEENKIERTKIEKEISAINSKVETALKEVKSAKKLLDDFEETDFKVEKETFEKDKKTNKAVAKTIKTEKEEKEEYKKKILKILQGLEVKLSGVIVCPSCQHNFVLDGDLDKIQANKEKTEELKAKVDLIIKKKESLLTRAKDKIEEIEEEISKINTKQSEQDSKKNKLSATINSCTESLNKIKKELGKKELELDSIDLKEEKRKTSIKNSKASLEKIDTDIKAINETIDLKKEKIELIEEQKNQLKVKSNKETIKNLKIDLQQYNTQFKESQIAVLKVQQDLDKKKEWIENFKQFRMYLANQSLSVIEYHCNRYLQEMKSDLVVKVEGFKFLADGSIREEITCKIIRNIERNFNSFSGGERGRLLFASILANRFMINETHPYGGLDFLAIDEVFEGVDSEGLISLIDSAKLLAIPVLLITHVSMEESENVLTIVKENGVSKIKY